ncbi:MAG TPA: hypothetical protein VLM85_26245 [Polyangiaceae bacterium]|nr:hypothetical protein [Polyangiaceae bacterium]
MRPRRPRVVPSLVLGASFIGVVPACALQGCGGEIAIKDGGSDAAPDQFMGVGAVAYCCFDAGVAVDAFIPPDAGDAADSSDGLPADAPGGG